MKRALIVLAAAAIGFISVWFVAGLHIPLHELSSEGRFAILVFTMGAAVIATVLTDD